MEWHLLEAVGQLLELVTAPIKQQMMTRACGQPHDHGEARQQERLADACCKLTVRIVAELAYSATHLRVRTFSSISMLYNMTTSRCRLGRADLWLLLTRSCYTMFFFALFKLDTSDEV